MGLLLGGLTFSRIFRSRIWWAYFRVGLLSGGLIFGILRYFTILIRGFLKFRFCSWCFPGLRRRVKTQKSPKKAIFQLWSPKKGQNFQDIKNSCIRIFYTHLKCVYGNSWPNSIKIERLDRFFVFWKNCWFFVKIVIFGQKVQFFWWKYSFWPYSE